MKHRNLMPFNLQFFAEGSSDGNGAEGSTLNNGDNPTGDNKPTYDELMEQLAQAQTQIAQANATSERYKNSINDLTKKNGELTKQVRERMTADEQADIAKKEADEAKDARIKELEEKMAVIDNTSFWGGASIGMDEALAKSTAEAEALGDKEKFRANIVKHIKAIKENAIQQALKDRPDISAGNGDADKNAAAKEAAQAAAKRAGTANQDILNHYRRK